MGPAESRDSRGGTSSPADQPQADEWTQPWNSTEKRAWSGLTARETPGPELSSTGTSWTWIYILLAWTTLCSTAACFMAQESLLTGLACLLALILYLVVGWQWTEEAKR